ncbi:MAG: hypothetical protein R3E47_15385 [Paracoccaceae bacterium]
MAGDINPIATHHLPSFIAAPGQTDVLLVGIGFFLLAVIFLLGIAFLWLHSLPERMAHHGKKIQFELVAVLCLLALFTHNNLLWGVALLLAMLDLPDLATPLSRISGALERMTGLPVAAGPEPEAVAATADSVATASAEAPATTPRHEG